MSAQQLMATPTDQIRVISHRKQPWAWFDKRVIRQYGRQLGPQGIAVYMALAIHVDGETQSCFPSYQTIAQEIGASRSTVLRAIALLCQLGLVSKEPMPSPAGDVGPNRYALLDVPALLTLSTGDEGVVSEGHHPSSPQTPPVVSEGHPNKNAGERDSENKKTGGQTLTHEEGLQAKRPLHQRTDADVTTAQAYARHLLATGQ